MNDLREAMYQKLLAGVTGAAIYWPYAPQPDDAGAVSEFPFIAVPNVTGVFFGARDTIGTNALVQLDIYARDTENKSAEDAVNELFEQVRAAIERQPLAIGSAWITTELESVTFDWDDGGKTRRAISLWRVIWHK